MSYALPEALDFTSQDAVAQALQQLNDSFSIELRGVGSAEAREQFRVRWFGDKAGLVNRGAGAWIKSVPAAEKREFGAKFNALKSRLTEEFETAGRMKVADANVSALDLTLPGTRRGVGIEHPLTRTMREMVAVFAALGYSVGLGPEVETDFYNFEALNFPPNHPARDTQDTLVVADQAGKPLRERLLMRTHTSPVQIRSMIAGPPPLRLVIPGKVHRNDESDATHSPIFHQVEGLCVDRGITFSDLKGTLDHAMKAFFGSSGEDTILSYHFFRLRSRARTCRSRVRFAAGVAAGSASIVGGSSCWGVGWWIRRYLRRWMRVGWSLG